MAVQVTADARKLGELEEDGLFRASAMHDQPGCAVRSVSDPPSTLPTDRDLLALQLQRGVRTVVTVPCSITSHWHAAVVEAQRTNQLDLITSTHEGNLIGLAAGVWFADGTLPCCISRTRAYPMRPMDSSPCASPGVFAIPFAMIVTYRGATCADDSEPHQEVGRRTDALVEAIFGSDVVIEGTRLGDTPVLESWSRVLDAACSGGRGC